MNRRMRTRTSGGVRGGAGDDPAYSMYAGHVLTLGGASPLRARESAPFSESKGTTARRCLKEAVAAVTT